jgi:hypothetical protein
LELSQAGFEAIPMRGISECLFCMLYHCTPPWYTTTYTEGLTHNSGTKGAVDDGKANFQVGTYVFIHFSSFFDTKELYDAMDHTLHPSYDLV